MSLTNVDCGGLLLGTLFVFRAVVGALSKDNVGRRAEVLGGAASAALGCSVPWLTALVVVVAVDTFASNNPSSRGQGHVLGTV